VKREEAVTREMTRKLAEDKKMSKKEKDERYDIGDGLQSSIQYKSVM
jgi:hypothetical protein